MKWLSLTKGFLLFSGGIKWEVNTQTFSGKLIKVDLGHSTVIYLALINANAYEMSACFLVANLYSHAKMKINCVEKCKNESKLNEDLKKKFY